MQLCCTGVRAPFQSFREAELSTKLRSLDKEPQPLRQTGMGSSLLLLQPPNVKVPAFKSSLTTAGLFMWWHRERDFVHVSK